MKTEVAGMPGTLVSGESACLSCLREQLQARDLGHFFNFISFLSAP